MILEVEVKEPYIKVYLNTRKNKELDWLLQLVIYRPSLDDFELLTKKILRMRKSKKINEIKELLKTDYSISYVKEEPYYYWDSVDKDIYCIAWRKQRYDQVEIPKGSTIYHLTREQNIDSILKDGLVPQVYTKDNVFLGINKVYFTTRPILDENEKYIDGHLYYRVQLEIEYDGTYELYKDPEYSHNKEHPMVYAITNEPIKVKGVSEIQPKRKYPPKKIV